MAKARDLSRAQIAFAVSERELDEFQVIRYRGTEGLCQLYRFEIELTSNRTGFNMADLVGKSAALSINTPHGERWFHGVINRFEISGDDQHHSFFRAELVPTLWLLTQRYNSRIFQAKNIEAIISDVLTRAGIATDRFRFVFKSPPPDREYCVQYRETDYNFICRLLEGEGIHWYFEHAQDSHTLVMDDAESGYDPIAGEAALPFKAPSGLHSDDECVFRWRLSQSVRPGAVTLNDFNYKNPALSLEAQGSSGRDAGFEFADYPGDYEEQGRGATLAQRRAEEFEAGRIVGVGQSNSPRIATARTFDLAEHPATVMNGSYFVTSISHYGKQAVARTSSGATGGTSVIDSRLLQSVIAARTNENPVIRELAEALLQVSDRLRAGDPTARRALTQWLYHAGQVSRDLTTSAAVSGANPLEWLTAPNLVEDIAQASVIDYDQPVYQCKFECISARTKYRPPRVTPWPVMRGCQTARVVGPQSEEIHTNEYGCIRVQFNWDREGCEGGQPKLFGADSSCWIRVAQGMAGGAYGMMFLPRVGQEVVVDFEEGNPDKPLVVGRVFNADHMPPYELPEEKTKSTIKTHTTPGGGGTNEIRFEDKKGEEQLFVQAQRQMDTRVKASHFKSVGGSYHLTVGGEKDGQLAGEYREKVFKAKHVRIEGESRLYIGEDYNEWIVGDVYRCIEGERTTSITGNVQEEFQGNVEKAVTGACGISAKSIRLEAQSGIELVCGGSSIVIAPGGVWIDGPMVYIATGPGPMAGPGGGSCAAPQLPEEPSGADRSDPGRDTRYGGEGRPAPTGPETPETPGHEFPEPEPPVNENFWVDIELVDKSGDPVRGELFEVIDSAGRKKRGLLDQNGYAHVTGVAEGEVQISFPNRDMTVWGRSEGPDSGDDGTDA